MKSLNKTKQNKTNWIMWSDLNTVSKFQLANVSGEVNMYSMVIDADTGKNIDNTSAALKPTTLKATNNGLEISITNIPTVLISK